MCVIYKCGLLKVYHVCSQALGIPWPFLQVLFRRDDVRPSFALAQAGLTSSIPSLRTAFRSRMHNFNDEKRKKKFGEGVKVSDHHEGAEINLS